MRITFTLASLIFISFCVYAAFTLSNSFWWILAIGIPFIGVGFWDMIQKKHAILRNFPLFGRSRYIAEWLRPKIYQYFVESDIDGKPIPRIYRSIVYQRAKKVLDTAPFGTQLNVYAEGYEWMHHSIQAVDATQIDHHPKTIVGGKDCLKKYPLSIFNISAMSYGSLSANAIRALNGGAAIGGFAHNTGEGGISPHHRSHHGDLIYQIGTGYFGCRDEHGHFSENNFLKTIKNTNVKMIEVKLSQGAKPGHGGILPAKKVTEEIASIRNIKMGEDVLSPPFHRAFDTPIGLLKFLKKLRDLSGGLPVGFKLCVGHRHEILAICKAMVQTGIKPDFITVDGGEGGTGAAPLEFSNSMGMPFREGLATVYDALIGFQLKKEITLIASGKIFTGFHIMRAIALGADACYSARGMMMALGCIQALECNKNTCPVGVATTNKTLMKALVVEDKQQRVANYHKETVEGFVELLAATGLKDFNDVKRHHIYRRIVMNRHETYEDIYPYLTEGCLLSNKTAPSDWLKDLAVADPNQFAPRFAETYIEED